jgi:hypothetical protein
MTQSFLFYDQEGVKYFDGLEKRKVDFTKVGKVEISTAFLVIDHNYGIGRPVLFETMVFKDNKPIYSARYCTRKDAEAGHLETVTRYSGALGKKKRKVEL